MSKKKKKPEKQMPIGLKLLLILLLSGSLVAIGVCVGFAAEDIFALVCAVPAVVIAFISLLFLLKDYKPKQNKKTSRWYVDKFLAALVPVWVLSAIFLIAVGTDGNEMAMYAGILMFPVISILITPNAAMYAVKDMKDWKKVFYGNGNLHSFKDTKEFFMMKAPVDFEKKLFRAVVRDQILNITTLISLMFVGAVAGLYAILTYDSHSVSPGDVFGAVLYVRVRRGTGLMAFVLLLVVVFGFPVFVYSATNFIYKLRIITSHKYLAYHAVVNNMNDGTLRINCDKRQYKNKYCILVGMREKQIDNTPAVLIFIPDDVLVFPDEIFKP